MEKPNPYMFCLWSITQTLFLIIKIIYVYCIKIGKFKEFPDPWKDWRQEEKGTIEDEMVGWVGITDSMDMSLNMLQQIVKLKSRIWNYIYPNPNSTKIIRTD